MVIPSSAVLWKPLKTLRLQLKMCIMEQELQAQHGWAFPMPPAWLGAFGRVARRGRDTIKINTGFLIISLRTDHHRYSLVLSVPHAGPLTRTHNFLSLSVFFLVSLARHMARCWLMLLQCFAAACAPVLCFLRHRTPRFRLRINFEQKIT